MGDSRVDNKNQQPAQGQKKLLDMKCGGLYTASLKCLDKNNYNKGKCEQEFEVYRTCRRQELADTIAERRAENARRSGGWF